MSNIFDMENRMSRITFQEKMLYAQLVAILGIVFFYAHYLVHAAPGHHYFHALLIVVAFLFASINTFARRRSGNVVEDERDRAVSAIGTYWSNIILWVGLLSILVMYWDHGGVRSASHLVGILFHLLVLAAIVRIIRELIAYRMAS